MDTPDGKPRQGLRRILWILACIALVVWNATPVPSGIPKSYQGSYIFSILVANFFFLALLMDGLLKIAVRSAIDPHPRRSGATFDRALPTLLLVLYVAVPLVGLDRFHRTIHYYLQFAGLGGG
jgi:hypothetical protein